MTQAAPNMKIMAQLFKEADLPLRSRLWNAGLACYKYAKETKTNLLSFYFYNIV
jgi:hypothetical protein